MDIHHLSITWLALGVEINKKMFVISKDPFLPEGRGPKINFGTPTIFEILQKFQKLFGHAWPCLKIINLYL